MLKYIGAVSSLSEREREERSPDDRYGASADATTTTLDKLATALL